MIQHVYERVLRAKTSLPPPWRPMTNGFFKRSCVRRPGGDDLARHRSGTDRIAEAADQLALGEDAIVVNVQGDQPLFEPIQVDEVVGPLQEDATVPMSTLIYRLSVTRRSSTERCQNCLR